MPDESAFSRAWRNRFDDTIHEYVHAAAHFVVKEVHDRNISAPEVRPKAEIVDDEQEDTDPVEDESFSQEEIIQTTRLALDHAFGHFDSDRATNVSYEDTQFFELQTFMGMVRCGTAQGATRFQYRRGEEYGPHGDTHLRTVKQFDPEGLVNGFNETTDRLLSVIASEASFRRPVTAAIDITTIPYYGDVEEMPMVSGTRRKPSRSVSATAAGGRSRVSTNRSKVTFSPRPPRKTTAFACSTSCSRSSCTISGGSPTSC